MPPIASWLTIPLSYIDFQVKKDKVKLTNFKELLKKISKVTQLLKMLDRMYKYEMLKIQNRHESVHRWTDKVKPVYPPFNFVEASGIKNLKMSPTRWQPFCLSFTVLAKPVTHLYGSSCVCIRGQFLRFPRDLIELPDGRCAHKEVHADQLLTMGGHGERTTVSARWDARPCCVIFENKKTIKSMI